MTGNVAQPFFVALMIGTGLALGGAHNVRAESGNGIAELRLAMDSMGGSMGGGSGGMMMDDSMTMGKGQSGGMGGASGGSGGTSMGQGGQGQTNSPGSMQSQGPTGQGGSQMGRGGMMMDGMMGMQAQPGGSGSSSGMSGQGGMMPMMDNMMRMMSGCMGGRSMPGMAQGVDFTDRIEGRIAFVRAELRVTDAQASAWNGFADAVRSARQHLIEARQLAQQSSASSLDRLDQHERHLSQRLEALKTARIAYATLYGMLDPMQKRNADELILPFIASF